MEWGCIMAKSFYDKYANKYVEISFTETPLNEIPLLIRLACILGKFEEDGNPL